MFSQELINEDNPYGMLPQEDAEGVHRQPPADKPREDPYHPDPYA
ncbi:hypothetical protein [Holophaga foetida]|nr:hypothetical protein [Holophaga foetida]